jgi:hypothetical protein
MVPSEQTMTMTRFFRFQLATLVGLVAAAMVPPSATSQEQECAANGEYLFICGPQSAEDLVLVPDTRWVIASGYGDGASFYLLNGEDKTWAALKVTGSNLEQAAFPACPAPPDFTALVTHGLNIRQVDRGQSILYAVGHGGREAIEVFKVDTSAQRPRLNWIGCILTPESMEANSVASLDDGSLFVTIPLEHSKTLADAMRGQTTGAVYKWSPGESGLTRVEGTELPYGNGIETSPDGREFYVASSGLFTVTAFSNTDPARSLRSSEVLPIVPDNLHRAANGQLITAGLELESADCGDIGRSVEFSLDDFARCPRPFQVIGVDPQSMLTEVLAKGPADPHFSNITMAVPVGDELWIGTFAGDRIAYRRKN